jgi:hypothetical protein
VLGAIVLANPYASAPLDFVLAANRVFVIANKCSIFERYKIYDVSRRTLTLIYRLGLGTIGIEKVEVFGIDAKWPIH